jgi:hypothetical protein
MADSARRNTMICTIKLTETQLRVIRSYSLACPRRSLSPFDLDNTP